MAEVLLTRDRKLKLPPPQKKHMCLGTHFLQFNATATQERRKFIL